MLTDYIREICNNVRKMSGNFKCSGSWQPCVNLINYLHQWQRICFRLSWFVCYPHQTAVVMFSYFFVFCDLRWVWLWRFCLHYMCTWWTIYAPGFIIITKKFLADVFRIFQFSTFTVAEPCSGVRGFTAIDATGSHRFLLQVHNDERDEINFCQKKWRIWLITGSCTLSFLPEVSQSFVWLLARM